jgi:hypothetical protein
MMALTPNEATITGALVGALLGGVCGGIVSFLTTRYAINHGPNYGKQIGDINQTLASLAKTQEELKHIHAQATAEEKERYAEEAVRAEAARWKPLACIATRIEYLPNDLL